MNEPIEVAFAPDRLAVLLKHFAELNDERESWRVAYPLKEVLLLVTCATIATCDDFDEIVLWGEHHLDFLRRFSDFHPGVPCARWLRDLMNRIDPSLFARCFESFVAAMWPQRHDVIAIDGKTARRTHDKRKGLKALHTLYGAFLVKSKFLRRLLFFYPLIESSGCQRGASFHSWHGGPLLGRAERSIPAARKGRAVRRAGLTAKARAER